jgi:hypothetical protein
MIGKNTKTKDEIDIKKLFANTVDDNILMLRELETDQDSNERKIESYKKGIKEMELKLYAYNKIKSIIENKITTVESVIHIQENQP